MPFCIAFPLSLGRGRTWASLLPLAACTLFSCLAAIPLLCLHCLFLPRGREYCCLTHSIKTLGGEKANCLRLPPPPSYANSFIFFLGLQGPDKLRLLLAVDTCATEHTVRTSAFTYMYVIISSVFMQDVLCT